MRFAARDHAEAVQPKQRPLAYARGSDGRKGVALSGGTDDRVLSSVTPAISTGPTGSKNPTPSGLLARWSAFYAIAELLEFFDHSCCARPFGLGTHRGASFLVADPIVQNQP